MRNVYKVSFLSDGSRVHITPGLFTQLKRWEMEGNPIPDQFADILKKQDHEWLCSTRSYYYHNLLLDETCTYQAVQRDNSYAVEGSVLSREQFNTINKALSLCTPTQRRRFAFYFYFGMTYEVIAQIEGVDIKCVHRAISRAIKTIQNNVF